jgi:hypothetical protein
MAEALDDAVNAHTTAEAHRIAAEAQAEQRGAAMAAAVAAATAAVENAEARRDAAEEVRRLVSQHAPPNGCNKSSG